jgi:hypothetical protein
MRKLALILAALFLAPLSMSAQSQTFWVSTAFGTALSDKLTNAMTGCTAQAPCIILINAYFPIITGETLPSPCANCTFRDYRAATYGNAATMNTGTTAGTVAAGDDSRFSAGSIPSGLVMFVDGTISACPTGYTQVSSSGNYVLLTTAANADAGTTGGSNSYTPAGTVAAPTFTGTSNQTTSAVSAGTPAGTNGTTAFTPSGTVAWPVGVPTFAGSAGTVPAETFTGSPGTVPAQTFTGSSATTSAVSAGTPAGTNGTAAVTSVGTKFTTSSSGSFAFTTLAGTASAASPTVTVPAEVFTGSALATHTHTLTATGTNATVSFTPAGTNSTAAFTPAGTVAWPAGVPTFSGGAGTVPAQTFTGSALGTHTHTLTPSGTNSAPAFAGTQATLSPTYLKLIPCRKN